MKETCRSNSSLPADNTSLNDPSPMMEVAFGDAASSKHMRVALCVALYAGLALIWMPGFSLGAVDIVLTPERPKPKTVLIRPPVEQPTEQVEVRETRARRKPMPDQTPLEAEPVIEPDPIEAPVVSATDDWVIGIPDAPPAPPEVVLYEGMRGVESPVITKRVQAEYPQKGARIRLSGYVILQAVMQADGNIGDVRVIRGLGKGKFGFEEAAVKALRQWEFLPGKYQGKPADVTLTLRVVFELN